MLIQKELKNQSHSWLREHPKSLLRFQCPFNTHISRTSTLLNNLGFYHLAVH